MQNYRGKNIILEKIRGVFVKIQRHGNFDELSKNRGAVRPSMADD
jgi:hypothetical protein